jgi:hypothetical protein
MMSTARRLLLSGLFAAAASAQMHAATAQSFPRIGAYLLNNPQNIPQEEAQIAKLGVVVLGMYRGWRGASGQTPQQVIAAIKKINPNIKIFIYTDITELEYPIPSGADSDLTPIDTNRWWLYSDGTSGSPVPSWFSRGYREINSTTYAKQNSSGQRYLEWRAGLDDSVFVKPNPSVDGLYVDNFFWAPRVNGDWTLSGGTQLDSSPTTQQIWRDGMVRYAYWLKEHMGSGKYVIGNVADWGTTHPITGYQGVLQGGVMEAIIGQSYSYESWEGWAAMMTYYKRVMSATAAPQLQIFDQEDTSSTDYQHMRYGLTSCLVGGNAYYYYDVGGTLYFYDEYNSNLGAATTAPPTAPYQHGVWRRDFENGIALVNPKGNGTQTVTLGASFKQLSGTQDPVVNNGETVTKVTLNERDGVILRRIGAAAAATPSAPSSVTIH